MTRHFPEDRRAMGLAGAETVFDPSATSRGLSGHLWRLEQPAAAVTGEYFAGAINRVGGEEPDDDDFYGTSHFAGPEARSVGEVASDKETEPVVRDPDPAEPREVRDRRRFHRDPAPGARTPLTAP